MSKYYRFIPIYALLVLFCFQGNAVAGNHASLSEIKKELAAIQKNMNQKLPSLSLRSRLLAQLALENAGMASSKNLPKKAKKVSNFNPAVSIVLNGKATTFSESSGEMAGFAVGEEGERGREGLGIDESELTIAANVDDKFYGSLTAAIVREDGSDIVELEEAYLQTLAGLQFIDGLTIKAGRAFWTIGYLNEHHAHTDDFADRPLPYRAFFNKAYNDDGVEVSYLLPTDFYAEVGMGAFRGDDFPFGGSDGEGIGAWSAFARVGSDIGANQSWRLGGYALMGEAKGGRATEEGEVVFVGDTDLYGMDFRYTFAPTGNAREREFILQGEAFWRDEDGQYSLDSGRDGTFVNHDDSSVGWYAQGVYKFAQKWRAGVRYSELESPDIQAGLVGTGLDGTRHDPRSTSLMLDYTNSEFSRWRFQYNHNELSRTSNDNQFMIQYIMSIGAHGAHKY